MYTASPYALLASDRGIQITRHGIKYCETFGIYFHIHREQLRHSSGCLVGMTDDHTTKAPLWSTKDWWRLRRGQEDASETPRMERMCPAPSLLTPGKRQRLVAPWRHTCTTRLQDFDRKRRHIFKDTKMQWRMVNLRQNM